MPAYFNLPSYSGFSTGEINFAPLNNALDDLGKTLEKNRLLREQKELGASLQPAAPGQAPASYTAQPINRLMSPAQSSAAAAGRELPTPSGSPYSNAISSIESGGRYDEVGPVTKSGDRAFGKYQVMGTNVGPWTREILGREMTPQQFLSDQDAQEKVFAGKFGQYVQKTGNPQDAASMWFTGRPLAEGANRRDILGTTGAEYVRRFDAAMGRGQPQTAAAPQAAPTRSGMNYDAGIRTALQQGNVALATQLQNAKQEEENLTYTRGRQATQDAQAAESHALTTQGQRDELQKNFVTRVAALAQNIASDPDPASRTAKWQRLVAADPRFAASLRQAGIDPSDVNAGTAALIAEARGLTPAKPEGLRDVAPGATVFDPSSRQPIFTAPARPSGDGIPSGYRVTADGRGLEFIPGGPADPTVKPRGRDKYTEVQTKAANFGNMMSKAEAELQGAAGLNPDGTPKQIVNPKNILGATRDALVPLESARNAMRPDETQAYEQAASQWIRAKLRKESGAAIGRDEMQKEFETYFPQYWDGPETIARKARARAEATRGMIAESGGAHKEFFEDQPEQTATPTPQQADQNLPVMNTPEEANALPSGTRFRTPDGRIKVKP